MAFVSRSILITILCLLAFIADLKADKVYLKNDRSIEGVIKSEDNEVVELEIYSGTIKIQKREIERIEKTTSEEAATIRQKWEIQKKETQDKILRQQLERERRPRGVEFSREDYGIILEVMLNKKVAASLILDTGASFIVLRKDVAKKLGINLSRVKPDMKLQLADGRYVNAKYVILESVKVEGIEAKNVEAAIMLDEIGDIGFGDGLLGMSFLKRFNFKVDHKEKKLILEKL